MGSEDWPQPPRLSRHGQEVTANTTASQVAAGDHAGLYMELPGDPPDVRAGLAARRGSPPPPRSGTRTAVGYGEESAIVAEIRKLNADVCAEIRAAARQIIEAQPDVDW